MDSSWREERGSDFRMKRSDLVWRNQLRQGQTGTRGRGTICTITESHGTQSVEHLAPASSPAWLNGEGGIPEMSL